MQKVENIAANVLRQLLSWFDDVPDVVVELLENMRSDARHRLEHSKITSAINDVASRFASVYIVVDALDECERSTTRRYLLTFIQELVDCNTRLFITARSHVQPPKYAAVVEIQAHQEDIETYVRTKLEDTRIRQGLREEIVSNLLKTACGT